MKRTRYRGIYTIEKTATGFVIRKRSEYIDTLPTMWQAQQRIDAIVCGYEVQQ